jgi:hypothetical protein
MSNMEESSRIAGALLRHEKIIAIALTTDGDDGYVQMRLFITDTYLCHRIEWLGNERYEHRQKAMGRHLTHPEKVTLRREVTEEQLKISQLIPSGISWEKLDLFVSLCERRSNGELGIFIAYPGIDDSDEEAGYVSSPLVFLDPEKSGHKIECDDPYIGFSG